MVLIVSVGVDEMGDSWSAKNSHRAPSGKACQNIWGGGNKGLENIILPQQMSLCPNVSCVAGLLCCSEIPTRVLSVVCCHSSKSEQMFFFFFFKKREGDSKVIPRLHRYPAATLFLLSSYKIKDSEFTPRSIFSHPQSVQSPKMTPADWGGGPPHLHPHPPHNEHFVFSAPVRMTNPNPGERLNP